jgi:hypothetical protein
MMGELKSGVSGFHNWLKFYYEEQVTQTANYWGYLVTDDFGEVRAHSTFLILCSDAVSCFILTKRCA